MQEHVPIPPHQQQTALGSQRSRAEAGAYLPTKNSR